MHRLVPVTCSLFSIALLLTPAIHADDQAWLARGEHGMVAADSPYASEIGASVLNIGGNAFDAAVATSLALTVTRPQSTGIGGGGFMIAYVAREKRFIALDFREMAPAAATAERYARLAAERGKGPSPSIYGGNAIGVPGVLAGLSEINKRFGTRTLRELAQPAIRMARDGFAVDHDLHSSIAGAVAAFRQRPEMKQRFGALYELLTDGDESLAEGALFRRPGLADALNKIAESGAGVLYDGPIAEAIVSAAQRAGGVLTRDDLRAYRAKERSPIRATFRDYELVLMPPPSSGGIAIAETLNIIEAAARRGRFDAQRDSSHVLVEAMKHAFADRARYLGDADFADVPVAKLISKEYAETLAARILPDRTRSTADYGDAVPPPEDHGTSHFCVADKFGNVVAITETVNGGFGSWVVAEPYGIVLNNQMDDFATVRGEANLYGLIQSDANLVGPGKRPLSSMSPTIVLKDGKPVLVVGAAGGPRIITSVLQVALHVMNGRPLDEAIAALRLHHQWMPNTLFFNTAPPAALADNLKSRGHVLSEKRRSAVVQAIQFLADGKMLGATDPHRHSKPVGVP